MACCLHGIRVEENLPLPAQSADFRNRLHGADFVVGKHDGNETGVVTKGVLDIRHPDYAVAVRVKQGDLKTFLLQLCQSVENSVMLKLCGDEVLFAFSSSKPGC